MAKAPMASGLISGANWADVPVVPHKKLANTIAKVPFVLLCVFTIFIRFVKVETFYES